MAQLEIATPGMFDDIFPLLRELNPALSREQWRALVDYPWREEGDEIGYVLTDAGRVVGFLGTIYSRRTIDGRPVRFCNTAHWIVLEPYRADSLRMLLKVLRQKDCTLTNLTSTHAVGALFAKLGYQVLDENVLLLLPEPMLPLRRGATLASDPEAVAAALDPEERRIFEHHRGERCGHLVVRDGDEHCYVLFTRLQRRVGGLTIRYGHIQHVSDRRLFQRHAARIKWHALRQFGLLFLAVDERLVDTPPGLFNKRRALGVPRYYRSDTLAPAQIDNLYTELAVGMY